MTYAAYTTRSYLISRSAPLRLGEIYISNIVCIDETMAVMFGVNFLQDLLDWSLAEAEVCLSLYPSNLEYEYDICDVLIKLMVLFFFAVGGY